MRAVLVTSEKNPPSLRRLQALDLRVQLLAPENIESVESDSTDEVYLIPVSLLASDGWNEYRVRLARASRRYIVFGEAMRTSGVMAAARDGAHDVLDLKADNPQRWIVALEHAANAQGLWWQLYGGQGEVDEENLVGRSSLMKTLRESIQRLGPTDATILLLGESGTGKERVAEAIHAASGKEVFIPINCAALPADLLESELFGAEKGAFTGADRTKRGLVEEAAGGTLFLDEIGELPIALQPKILRFLETRMARRVGSTKEYQTNVRLVSATNRNLRAAAESENFRPDLFYRLSEVILNTPPLRHRAEDIPDLARSFLRQAAVRVGKNFESLEPELIQKFQQHDWPGNVRELKQAIERLAFLYDGPIMRAGWWDLPLPRHSAAPMTAGGSVAGPATPMYPRAVPGGGLPPSRRGRMALARQFLQESNEDLAWVAAQIGVHPTTLYRWRKSGKL